MKKKYAIIVAGGKGLRMKTDIPKQFLLLNGLPVLMHTIRVFYHFDSSIEIILVLPKEQQNYWSDLCKQHHFTISHHIADGGETRFHSVKNGLQLIKEESLVAIHDGVRPLVSGHLISKAFRQAEIHQASYPVIPVVDTLRKYTSENESQIVDRSKYCLVQTPQVFCSEVIIKAYQLPFSEYFTDDISVVEKKGNCKPIMIDGCRENIKITTPIDLTVAETLLKCRI
ncbi:MAG: 2-C-methyl-D-erythritol 4-phosphate cytidylyltransferase [Dysgonamonadaceae bacterium]|jgi:2-C-methyl-D-erythritol 4-phosphate cytidylyltransferase|nr:2-C-methyl-D-erythritol 4-phosphate cytidylyltransferase [Dysgonamonadaceae bacterium]